jgi:hypothetical protein
MRMRRVLVAVGLMMGLAVVGLAACGSDSGGGADQPGDGQEVSGAFANLPKPESTPLGDVTTTDKTATQSFKVPGYTPQFLQDYYAQALPAAGWSVIEAVQSTGTTDNVSVWGKDGLTLRVTCSLASPTDTSTQLNLQLTSG